MGDNSVIGAYSVITCDIPANAAAMNIPCRAVGKSVHMKENSISGIE